MTVDQFRISTMGEGLRRLSEMEAGETMMSLAVKANSQYAFETGLENYASARWDKTRRDVEEVLRAWPGDGYRTFNAMEAYQNNREAFFAELYDRIFSEDGRAKA